MTTVANPRQEQSAHWYSPKGEPMHTVIAKGTGQPRPTTLADARKLGLLPSVTNILKILHKPALQDWLTEQAVLACLTTPRRDGEPLDTFVHRVLHEERVQDQESQVARDRGTEMHDALEALFNGQEIDESIRPWVEPCFEAILELGPTIATEKVVVSRCGYGGRIDLIQGYAGQGKTIWDFKSTRNIPKSAYQEHRLQLSAYAQAWLDVKQTANAYISTVDCGKFCLCFHEEPWTDTFDNGFLTLVKYWQWANNYKP